MYAVVIYIYFSSNLAVNENPAIQTYYYASVCRRAQSILVNFLTTTQFRAVLHDINSVNIEWKGKRRWNFAIAPDV